MIASRRTNNQNENKILVFVENIYVYVKSVAAGYKLDAKRGAERFREKLERKARRKNEYVLQINKTLLFRVDIEFNSV